MKTDRKNTEPLAKPINAETYLPRTRAYIREHNGEGFVIREGGPNWAAWMAYFDRIGYKHPYADSKGVYTVACAWPAMFDPTAGALGIKAGRDPGRFDLGEAR